MKADHDILIKEKKLLTLIASLIFSLTLINLGLILIENLKFRGIDFGEGSYSFYIPMFRFFSLLTFPFVFWSKRLHFSTIFTGFSFFTFSFEIFLSVRANIENEYLFSTFELIEIIARPLDYLVFLLISVLLFWQISILLRILIKLTQRKTELP